MAREWLWQGIDNESVSCRIERSQWYSHVLSRPEIARALLLTIQTMVEPTLVERDNRRPDEETRRFRLLSRKGSGRWRRHWLRVSVKYVLQPDGAWIKFYQSCWYERVKQEERA